MENITNGLGIEIKFDNPNDFLKIKETLQRIGIASKKTKTLIQSCHILHKQGRYFIMMFKEMFALDGKKTDFTDEDRIRRNTITKLLEEWGLLTVIEREKIEVVQSTLANIKVVSFKDKKDWILANKYSMGTNK